MSARGAGCDGSPRTATRSRPGSCPSSRIRSELDRYIAASQVGITLSSLILGAYAQATLAPRLAPLLERFGPTAAADRRIDIAVVVLLILTTLAVIVGELVPKSLALQNPTETALFTVHPDAVVDARVFMVDRAAERQRRPAAEAARACRRPGIATCTRPKRSSCSSPRAATAGCSNRRSRSGCIARCGSGCGPRVS